MHQAGTCRSRHHAPRRARRRLGALALACAALAAAAPAAAPAATQQSVDAAVTAGAGWIATQQDATSGELAGFGGDWSLSALAAAGVHAADLGTPSAQDFYLGTWTSSDWTDPPDPATGWNAAFLGATDFERALLLAHAAGLQPSRLSAQQNLVAQLAVLYDAGNGGFGAPSVNGAAFGLFALAPAHVPRTLLAKTAAFVRANRHTDGGWTYAALASPASASTPSDVDMTGAALAALCAAGATPEDPYVADGLAFLHGKLIDATGAFDAMFGVNADSNAWAIQGLNGCGIDPQSAAWTTPAGKTPLDFLLSLQRTSGPNTGSFKYAPSEGDGDSPNLYSSQDTLRPLTGAGFVADPPARAQQGDPVVLPAPTVTDGTPVPLALALDDGHGDVRLCRVVAPTGSTVADVLDAAQADASPAGCVSAVTTVGGEVTSLNGTDGDWRASVDGAAEAPAGLQTVGLGDLVSLRLPAAGVAAPDRTAIDFGVQVQGTIGAAHPIWVRAQDATLTLARVRVVGDRRDDFLLSADDCSGTTLQPGAGCAIRVRYAPAATSASSATLQLRDAGDRVTTIALGGSGAAAPQGGTGPSGDPGPSGPKGDTGTSGPQGPAGAAGPRGATGRRGTRGARGAAGRDTRVTCRLVRAKGTRRVICAVVLAGRRVQPHSSARLLRHGHTYATGTLARLRQMRPLTRGGYTLRLIVRGRLVRVGVKVG